MFDDDGGTEAEYLSDRADEGDEETRQEVLQATVSNMTCLYEKAKSAPVKSKIICPSCGKKHNKTSYQKVFCRNKGRNNCKDRYWNTVSDTRRDRAKIFC